MENNPQPLNIPYPPDYVFKYRNKNRVAPAQEVMESRQAMFVFERMEYPESGGQFAYFKDVPYPAKGHPFPEAIYAMNFVKRFSRNAVMGFAKKDMWKEGLGFILSSKKNKIKKITRFLDLYNDIAKKVVAPYILEERYLSTCAREILVFLNSFLIKLGISDSVAHEFAETFACQIDYDNAYRFRIEDIMSETTGELFIENPAREMKKLAKLLQVRDTTGGSLGRVDTTLEVFSYLMWVPRIKRAFVESIRESNFWNFQLDEADRYHVLLWADYNFLGKTLEERLKIYAEHHKDGYPPRIVYTPA